MQMIMFVLDDPNQLDSVLDAWQAIGVSGVTVVESTGFHRRQAQRLGARYLFSLPRLVERIERGHYTLFAIMPDIQMVQKCLDAVEKIVGDLADPNTGILAAWELSLAKGVPDQHPDTEADE